MRIWRVRIQTDPLELEPEPRWRRFRFRSTWRTFLFPVKMAAYSSKMEAKKMAENKIAADQDNDASGK
jgi:hypothetical protein